jgi:hypothetical protein
LGWPNSSTRLSYGIGSVVFGLHAICVRVGAGHKERGHKNGVSFRIHGLYHRYIMEHGTDFEYKYLVIK